jgi:Ca2+:H+ antiporter
MLFLATVALVMPAVVDLVSFGSLQAHPEEIDRLRFWTSIVLLVVYIAGLIFSFKYNRDPLRAGAKPGHAHHSSMTVALTVLAAATVLTTLQAEVLVAALEPAMKSLGMTELFAGVIVVALVGNAAEHYSAVNAARANKMTLALEISVGSSAQIALMVAPVLVLLSYALATRCRWCSTPSRSPRLASRCWRSRWCRSTARATGSKACSCSASI